MADLSNEVASPCISVCVIDEVTQICQGCFRTLHEIEDWWGLDNAQKQKVIDDANQRASSMFD
ncbi:MAG: DUF1289 domain-containing protein [Methylophilaceae bacterium]|nr:MAG: DUF1289 domain-containing protein [Methylophilaceae bacterium]